MQVFAKDETSQSLISYPGDSSLYVDPGSRTLLVIDPTGKVGRVMAIPRPQDTPFLSYALTYGNPAIDKKGRILYRGVTTPRMPNFFSKYVFPIESDSAPIIRADFETRKVDTIARIHALEPNKIDVVENPNGVPMITMTVNPLVTIDQWAQLTDGTIAIVRAKDYHIDWIDIDGTHRSTAKMPFDWLLLSDDAKKKKVDSLLLVMADNPNAREADIQVQTTGGTPVRGRRKFAVKAARDLPDYESALTFGALTADLENHLWILPRTSKDASSEGLVYDVVSKDGKVVERVRLPKSRLLAGFGPNGAVYMIKVDGDRRFLEQTQIR
ncbi:MAG: hypothetical protein ABJB66_07120 [Gemmatimonadaceae bacterium]